MSSVSTFSISVLRQCNNTCTSADLYCPVGQSVDVGKSLVCVDQLRLSPELVGLWQRYTGHNLTVHLRVLRACYKNRVLDTCLGLHGKCRRGSTFIYTSHHDGVAYQYTLCLHVFLKSQLVGSRCVYTSSSFSCSKQFVAGDGKHHNLAQLSPGEGQTPEDDYEYDSYWFLWYTPKPGSGYDNH